MWCQETTTVLKELLKKQEKMNLISLVTRNNSYTEWINDYWTVIQGFPETTKLCSHTLWITNTHAFIIGDESYQMLSSCQMKFHLGVSRWNVNLWPRFPLYNYYAELWLLQHTGKAMITTSRHHLLGRWRNPRKHPELRPREPCPGAHLRTHQTLPSSRYYRQTHFQYLLCMWNCILLIVEQSCLYGSWSWSDRMTKVRILFVKNIVKQCMHVCVSRSRWKWARWRPVPAVQSQSLAQVWRTRAELPLCLDSVLSCR